MKIPEKINKYEIKSVLGEGAMGLVFHGYDPKIGRDVAIKTIHRHLLEGDEGEDWYKRFIQEVRAVGSLSHPNIVAIYDTDDYCEKGGERRLPFFVMEFVRGRELEDYLRRGERFALKQALAIVCRMLDAFEYTHNLGVIHRDIKPANIFITDQGEVKIADFGIARIENSNLTQVGSVLGTPNYMSPEQCAGQVLDNRSDLFSIAVVCYELLTGEKPFHAGSLHAVMHKVINTRAEPVSALAPGLPRALDAVLDKALAKSPRDRFQTAAAFRLALAAFLDPGAAGDATRIIAPVSPGRRQGAQPAAEEATVVAGFTQSGAGAVGDATAVRTPPFSTPEVGARQNSLQSARNASVAPEVAPDVNVASKTAQDVNSISQAAPGKSGTAAKKPGKWWFASAAAVCLAAVVSVYLWWWSTQGNTVPADDAPEPTAVSQLNPEQRRKLERLLRAAEVSERSGRLVWPPSSNAVYIYRLALRIDPGNRQVQESLKAIAETLREKAVSLYKQGEMESLRAHLDISLEAFPDNEWLQQYRAKLERDSAG